MTAKEIFDICHDRYHRLREWLVDSTGAVHSVDLESPLEGYQWRPDRARACEYIADFERIGRQVLRHPRWKGRLKLFNAYFVRGADYRHAVRLVGVAECTFDYWYREVKRVVGAEFGRTGLFPPSRYFQSRLEKPESRIQEGLPSCRQVEPGRLAPRPRRRSRPPRRLALRAGKKLPPELNVRVEGREEEVRQQV
jgi:hypothetical protein